MRKCTKLWKTKNGYKVRVCDMSDGHLDNTIAYLKRFGQAVYDALVSKAGHAADFFCGGGEMAQMMCEDYEGYLLSEESWEDHVPDIYWDMKSEKERRELHTYINTDFRDMVIESETQRNALRDDFEDLWGHVLDRY